MAQDYSAAFYKSKQWQATREAYASSKRWLCEDCLAKGIIKPGVIVHHIEHITPQNIERPEITMNFANLRLVCRDCHALEHKTEKDRRYIVDEDGRVVTR